MSARVELRRDAGRIGPGSSPWIRERQIARTWGVPDPAELVALVQKDGTPLAWGLFSEASRIRVRIVQWGAAPPPDDWLEARIASADAARARLFGPDTTGYRVINSEGDGLPGLIVDRFGEERVVQIATAPMLALRDRIRAALRNASAGSIHVIVRDDAARHEGIEPMCEREGDPSPLEFLEHGLRFVVPPPPSQKTGAYFDQRANRRWVAHRVAAQPGARVLDLGCHAGGFAMHARAAGAEVVAADRSQSILDIAANNAAKNDLADITFVATDMFGSMPEPALAGPFDIIVADPPKVVARRRDLDAARTGMAHLVARLSARLAADGILLACSCSHHFGIDKLDEAAAAASERLVRIARLGADVDHPIDPGHVEGEYLRVAVYQRR